MVPTHLVHVKVVDDGVEAGVQVVEQRDNLRGKEKFQDQESQVRMKDELMELRVSPHNCDRRANVTWYLKNEPLTEMTN